VKKLREERPFATWEPMGNARSNMSGRSQKSILVVRQSSKVVREPYVWQHQAGLRCPGFLLSRVRFSKAVATIVGATAARQGAAYTWTCDRSKFGLFPTSRSRAGAWIETVSD
jgi:hypothetical protein